MTRYIQSFFYSVESFELKIYLLAIFISYEVIIMVPGIKAMDREKV